MMNASRAISDVERVKDAADIVRIVGEHVTLKAKGREYVGLCPFHDDHSPSMCVVPSKQIFHCFVCGAGGDVLSFIERYHRMDFREALEYLADRCNITLTPFNARHPHDTPQGTTDPRAHNQAAASAWNRKALAQANAQAAGFYRAILNHPEHGKAARQIILRRGISDDMVERFTLGAAPDRWDGLAMKIDALGQDRGLYSAAGLLKSRDDSSQYDTFRNRLMFPIRDQIGRVIAFGGRRINDEDEPKYINSPETLLFHKSASLFGLYQAVKAIQHQRTAIVTEGYTDVIACHQAGIEHVVAALGTALTPGHARILRRLCDTVVLLFDGDDAGQRAADRAVEVFFAESVDVRIATLASVTDAKDPDELLKREGGLAIFEQAIAASTDILKYRFARLSERLSTTSMSARERQITEELDRLAGLGFHKCSPIRQKFIIVELMEITGLDHAMLYDYLRKAHLRANRHAQPDPIDHGSPSQAELDTPSQDLAMAGHTDAEHDEKDPDSIVDLLGCILTEPNLWLGMSPEDRKLIAPAAYRCATMRALATALIDLANHDRTPSLGHVLDVLEDARAKSAAVALQTHIEEIAQDRVGAHYHACLRTAHRAKAKAGVAIESKDDFSARIQSLREQQERFGPDRRVVPKPGSPP